MGSLLVRIALSGFICSLFITKKISGAGKPAILSTYCMAESILCRCCCRRFIAGYWCRMFNALCNDERSNNFTFRTVGPMHGGDCVFVDIIGRLHQLSVNHDVARYYLAFLATDTRWICALTTIHIHDFGRIFERQTHERIT